MFFIAFQKKSKRGGEMPKQDDNRIKMRLQAAIEQDARRLSEG
jgi:hypothetical protein